MVTDQFTTNLTSPRLFLAIKKLLNSVLFDEIQILHHAHSVTRSVPAVNGSQPITWKATALKTEIDLLICQFGTFFRRARTNVCEGKSRRRKELGDLPFSHTAMENY
jgi:hypothetical protein